jgi:hypothetical protein
MFGLVRGQICHNYIICNKNIENIIILRFLNNYEFVLVVIFEI